MINCFKINYNIKIYRRVSVFLALPFAAPAFGQQPQTIKKNAAYCHEAKKDSFQRMVDLRGLVPYISYDLRYATAKNFTGQRLYRDDDVALLRLEPAMALQKIQEKLRPLGYCIRIWDAYRPHSVTRRMWELIGDERYVAHPSRGSAHNRGLAVDLTLVDSTGKELDMGTGFDHFSDTSHHDFTALPENVIVNRRLLKKLMEDQGFQALLTEWWHYSWPNNRNYAILDIEPGRLRTSCH